MKEVLRSGRATEWSSEQTRGETVGRYCILGDIAAKEYSGYTKSHSRVCRVDEHVLRRNVGSY